MRTKDFLLEIGCEELPAKGLFSLAYQVGERLSQAIKQTYLDHDEVQCFATPRRLAVLVKNLSERQADRQAERRGPALNAPLQAREGFAKSCGVSLENLVQKDNYYYFQSEEEGQDTQQLLPEIVNRALSQLTGIKTMRWGNHTVLFLRPVHWIVMLYGEEKIDAEILGLKTTRETLGHRFHHPAKLMLLQASHYAEILQEEGFVQVDFIKRREFIRQELRRIAVSIQAKITIDEDLLEEVTGLVEWPVVLLCNFSRDFLSVPKEALISSMQHHQKCFPLQDVHDHLVPYFLTVSNLQSQNPKIVIAGNERVMHARLSDAAFFYEQDKKIPLISHLQTLEKVLFQKKLGSMADKVKRLIITAEKIAEKIHADKAKARRVAQLCKTDLMTQMVNEFPELQGIMGEYYAKNQGETEEIAKAIEEHYLPRFAGDKVPRSALGCIVALSDRFDTLNGIFKSGEIPTGDKDPFGLRRSALGIIRIIIEKELKSIDLLDFCEISDVHYFILERLPAYYQEQKVAIDTLQAVLEVEKNNLYDIHQRVMALQHFRHLPEALALSEGNKRVKNILKKNEVTVSEIDTNLFENPAEKNLYKKIVSFPKEVNYKALLIHLASFREPIDQFFTDVMVEVDDKKIKQNRLLLLQHLRSLFLKAADISLLQFKS